VPQRPAGELADDPGVGAIAEGATNPRPQIDIGDPSPFAGRAKLRQAQVGACPEQGGAFLYAVVERPVLERVQRVVMDEDADRPLIGQRSVGARQSAIDRIRGRVRAVAAGRQ